MGSLIKNFNYLRTSQKRRNKISQNSLPTHPNHHLPRFYPDVSVMIDGVVKVSRIGGQGYRVSFHRNITLLVPVWTSSEQVKRKEICCQWCLF